MTDSVSKGMIRERACVHGASGGNPEPPECYLCAVARADAAKVEIERLRDLLTNVERRQADVRREVKLLNRENRRLREDQPDRVAMEKKIAKLESSLTQCTHKCAELTRSATPESEVPDA